MVGPTRNTLSQLRKCDWKISGCLDSMQHNVTKGYGEQLTDSHPTPETGAVPVWYIPIFPVVNATKAKLHLVFDASVQYLGVSIVGKLN